MTSAEEQQIGAVREQSPQPPPIDTKPKMSIPRAGEENWICDVPQPGPPWIYT